MFTKEDLKDDDGLADVYRKSGFETFSVSSKTGKGVEQIKASINGRICVFSGNSGVGKSTLLNALIPELSLETGEISDKLGRGRHTTRQVELFKVGDGSSTFANLPWASARAADVYDWAKAATKPTYTASEIQGLADYIGGRVEQRISLLSDLGVDLPLEERMKLPKKKLDYYKV